MELSGPALTDLATGLGCWYSPVQDNISCVHVELIVSLLTGSVQVQLLTQQTRLLTGDYEALLVCLLSVQSGVHEPANVG